MTLHLDSIARQFVDTPAPLSIQSLGAGNINDTYRIDFQGDKQIQSFVLQRINRQIFTDPEAVMRNIDRVTRHLQQQNAVASPAPLRTHAGALLHVDEHGEYWRCFPFIPNSYSPEGKASPEIAFAAAAAFGAFAGALRDFPAQALSETIPGFHDTDRRWLYFQEIVGKDPAGRVAASQAEIAAMWEAKSVFDTVSQLKKSGQLPVRVTHNDTKAGNVLFDLDSGQPLAVIDLDTVMPGVILSDFGDMVRSFVPEHGEDAPVEAQLRLDVLQALESGFLAGTAEWISEAERTHLLLGGVWITGEQALRFLSDWLAGDVYYKIKTPDHNLVRARNQISVFRALQKLLDTSRC